MWLVCMLNCILHNIHFIAFHAGPAHSAHYHCVVSPFLPCLLAAPIPLLYCHHCHSPPCWMGLQHGTKRGTPYSRDPHPPIFSWGHHLTSHPHPSSVFMGHCQLLWTSCAPPLLGVLHPGTGKAFGGRRHGDSGEDHLHQPQTPLVCPPTCI